MNYASLEVTPNGHLKMTLTDEGCAYLKELMDSSGDKWNAGWLFDLLESVICNPEYSLINPTDVGALTEAPIIGDGYNYADDGSGIEHTADARLWWYEEYQVLNEYEELLNDGFIIFTASPDNPPIKS